LHDNKDDFTTKNNFLRINQDHFLNTEVVLFVSIENHLLCEKRGKRLLFYFIVKYWFKLYFKATQVAISKIKRENIIDALRDDILDS